MTRKLIDCVACDKINITRRDLAGHFYLTRTAVQITEDSSLILAGFIVITITAAPVTIRIGSRPVSGSIPGTLAIPHIAHHGVHVKQAGLGIKTYLVLGGIQCLIAMQNAETEIVDGLHPGHEVVVRHRFKRVGEMDIQRQDFLSGKAHTLPLFTPHIQYSILRRNGFRTVNRGNGKNGTIVQRKRPESFRALDLQRQLTAGFQFNTCILQRKRTL